MKKETILAIIVSLVLISGAVYFVQTAEKEGINGKVTEDFIQCLADAGVVIYGSKTCPACYQLEQEYGGYEKIKLIYLDCSGLSSAEEEERCMDELKTGYVPEIQIDGEVFEKWGSPENLAKETGCEI